MAVVYFAYGSNMLSERLAARCPGARPLGAAVAPGFSLAFCKRGRDGSGKATLVKAEGRGRPVYGVLFRIGDEERALLDKAEGGYRRDDAFPVLRHDDGTEVQAMTYIARPDVREHGLVPFDWYRALVVAGAIQHQLPEAHIRWLRGTAAQPDPDPAGPARREALRVLERAGFRSLADACS